MKPFYTTGEAAEICGLSQQTIIRCFEAGSLEGWRVPGSRFRRIGHEALRKFMLDNKIPPYFLTPRVLLYLGQEKSKAVSKLLRKDTRLEPLVVESDFQLGMQIKEAAIAVIAFNLLRTPAEVFTYLHETHGRSLIIGMPKGESPDNGNIASLSDDSPEAIHQATMEALGLGK